jgi:transcriptional regulator with XRE-family HTH domain
MAGIPNNDILMRISTLCEERNWSLYRLAKESEIPYTSISNMFARNTQPTVHTLEKLCEGFGISMSTFFDTPVEKHPNTYVLSDNEKKIIDIYRSLNAPYRELMETYMESIAVMAQKGKGKK